LIQGSFSLNTSINRFKYEQVNESAAPEAVFHSVVQGDFTGGYFLHPRLPYSLADLYYSDEANDILVLMTGYVYNKSELLPLCNITLPAPNPELIAVMFLQEGPDFVKKLNGDFAIFILRQRKKQAWLFRDHVGVHPLAWAIDRQTLFFSSDIIGLCRAFSDRQTINRDYLLGYFKYIDYRATPNEKVKKLLPGHFLHFSENGIRLIKYWEPEKIKTDKKLPHDRMISDLRFIVHDAVKIRCDPHFTAGAHVSSGIDSGIVSALARKEYSHQDNFYGFSWSPADFAPSDVKYDEREIVIKSCEKANIKPLFSDMKGPDFQQIVSGFYDNHGYFSEDRTVEQAVKVETNLIFSGWGGDEFISSGDRGIEQDLLSGLKLRVFFRRNPIKHPKVFIRNQLLYILYPALGILDRGTAKSFRDDAHYIKKPFKSSDKNALRNFYFHTSRHQLHLRLLRFYHLQERCESWAVNGYWKGVEYRYPLLDRRIIEYMLKVPSELLCKTDHFRPLLREISEGILPDEVRLNLHKNDPVYWAYMAELFKEAAILFMKEVDEWKDNPDLYFVDFKLFDEDIRKFIKRPDEVDQKVLFRALVYTKAIHEFVKRYRGDVRYEM
jgi:asparagine synthase (glutamine-hydrolysing)